MYISNDFITNKIKNYVETKKELNPDAKLEKQYQIVNEVYENYLEHINSASLFPSPDTMISWDIKTDIEVSYSWISVSKVALWVIITQTFDEEYFVECKRHSSLYHKSISLINEEQKGKICQFIEQNQESFSFLHEVFCSDPKKLFIPLTTLYHLTLPTLNSSSKRE